MIIFKLTLKRKCVKWCKQFKYYHEMRALETLDKFNKIWLKGLN